MKRWSDDCDRNMNNILFFRLIFDVVIVVVVFFRLGENSFSISNSILPICLQSIIINQCFLLHRELQRRIASYREFESIYLEIGVFIPHVKKRQACSQLFRLKKIKGNRISTKSFMLDISWMRPFRCLYGSKVYLKMDSLGLRKRLMRFDLFIDWLVRSLRCFTPAWRKAK